MKKSAIIPAAAIVFLATVAALVFGKSPGPSPTSPHALIDHEHTAFKAVKTLYEFENGTTVEWVASENPNAGAKKDTAIYTVTITTNAPPAKAYSMFTLGLQSARHIMHVTNINPASVTVQYAFPPTDTALKAFAANTTVDVPAVQVNGGSVNPDYIGFIMFTGTKCQFTVWADRENEIFGNTTWYHPGPQPPAYSHDNDPPVNPPN
jgi:hypothetical protein